jgi:hypothetical protein
MNPDLNVNDFPILSRDLKLGGMNEYDAGFTWNQFYWQVVDIMTEGGSVTAILNELLRKGGLSSPPFDQGRAAEIRELMEYAEYSMH